MKAFSIFAVLSALLSIVSWTYRFIDEYSRYQEIAFYILVPVVSWGGVDRNGIYAPLQTDLD
ncbi:MAG: hypothetical protein ACRBB4_10505 [Neptuniibacter sp.]